MSEKQIENKFFQKEETFSVIHLIIIIKIFKKAVIKEINN